MTAKDEISGDVSKGDSLEEDSTVQDVSKAEITDYAPSQLLRRLDNRQIQSMAVGGSVGTALFVSIGGGLAKSGPLGLLLGYSIYSIILACVNNGLAEMTIMYPVPGGFIRLAGRWVDDAFGFMAGWNFFLYEALSIPFEITALLMVLKFWRDDIPAVAVCCACIAAYATLSVFAVKIYGESEFWGSGGKVIVLLFTFTFITMIGGNPQHHAFGFQYWKNPGPIAEYLNTGPVGRFEGVLSALWTASFTIAGPEYVNLIAAEAKRPRVYIKTAFKVVYRRFLFFYIMAAICVGVLVAYNDPTLVAVFLADDVTGTAAATPFVIAMQNMKIEALPHRVNALLLTTIFSAGNCYMYCASRSLYGLALDGRAPSVLQKCTKKGVPIYCVFVAMCFPLLSLLSISNGSSEALTWLTSLITAGALIKYIVICITYLAFYRACKVQNLDRRSFPYYGRYQPYIAWAAECVILVFYGYSSFMPWSVTNFFTHYAMVFVAILLYAYWKIVKRTRVVKPMDFDLVWDRPVIDAYENGLEEPPSSFWRELLDMVRWNKKSKHEQGSRDSEM
ncbi:hypothetical protein N7528_004655 [Penicillium herquei]|nr:hypothetical protein N7528_004655 [Penicillium herquei]